jgi:hypothetical protein
MLWHNRAMRLPFDPHFPHTDEDHALASMLPPVNQGPVFIMGLHRSGTTFLYDLLRRTLPVAELELYHLFYFRRLLHNARYDLEKRDRATLNRLFQALGIRDRSLDAIHISDATVEEYGWLLGTVDGTPHVTENNVAILDLLCRKLAALRPEAAMVILKNPWDIGHAHTLLHHFPEARFVYIHRNPVAILRSEVEVLHTLLTGRQPFHALLTDFLLEPRGRLAAHLAHGLWGLARLLHETLPRAITAPLFRRHAAHQIRRDLLGYRHDLQQLPGERVFELGYEELIGDPVLAVGRIARFLDLEPLTQVQEAPPVKPRSKVAELTAFEQRFLQHLADMELLASKVLPFPAQPPPESSS